MDNRWHLDFLGGLRARQGEGTEVVIKSDAAKAVLTCLALRPERPWNREELAKIVWKKDYEGGYDSDVRDRLLHNLNSALSQLRGCLMHPDVLPKTSNTTELKLSKKEIGLIPGAFVTDVGEFKGLLAAAASATALDERIRLLRAATDLYRGELMPGFNEDWIRTARQELADACCEACGSLTQAYFDGADYEGALKAARRWLLSGPNDERAHRALMETFAALGRTPEALQHYDDLVRRLGEAARRPDPQTQELAERLRAARPPSRTEETPQEPPSVSKTRLSANAWRVIIAAVIAAAALGFWGTRQASRRDHLLRQAGGQAAQRDGLLRRGWEQWDERTPDGLEAAGRSFLEAARTNPGCGPAYAGVADVAGLQGYYGWRRPQAAFDTAEANARRAVSLAKDARENAEAYTALGWADMMAWRWGAAERDFTTAIRFDPQYSTAHQWYSLELILFGREAESETEIGIAAGLAPASPVIAKSLGQRLFYGGAYSEAIRHCSDALTRHPDDGLTTLWLGLAYEQQGDFQQAIPALRRAIALSQGGDVGALAALGHAYAASGDDGRARLALRQLQGRRHAAGPGGYVSPVALALVCAGLYDAEHRPQDKTEALRLLRLGYREHAGDLILVGVDPRLKGLQTDPQFLQLFRQLGLKR